MMDRKVISFTFRIRFPACEYFLIVFATNFVFEIEDVLLGGDKNDFFSNFIAQPVCYHMTSFFLSVTCCRVLQIENFT